MMRIVVFVVCMLAGFAGVSQTMTTFILVRHAEKASGNDPGLTPEGQARADRLKALLQNTPVDAVYTTNFNRTRDTATPVATAHQLTPQVYEPNKSPWVDQVLSTMAGKTIVVVGHSNTIPWLANELLGQKQVNDFADTEYENILIVTVTSKGQARLVRLTY